MSTTLFPPVVEVNQNTQILNSENLKCNVAYFSHGKYSKQTMIDGYIKVYEEML